MAITIDGKSYDETKLDDKCKNSIVQVNSLQTRLRNLSAEFDNVKVLIKHHSEYLTANLPASAIVETPKLLNLLKNLNRNMRKKKGSNRTRHFPGDKRPAKVYA